MRENATVDRRSGMQSWRRSSRDIFFGELFLQSIGAGVAIELRFEHAIPFFLTFTNVEQTC